MSTHQSSFIGIDVSKHSLEVAFGCRLALKLHGRAGASVGRATPDAKADLDCAGGNWRAGEAAFVQPAARWPASVPCATASGARLGACRAKTDPLDVRLFAERMQPPAQKLLDEQQQLLRDLLTRREQLIQMRTAEVNRLASAARQCIQKHIDWLNQEIDTIDRQLDDLVEQTQTLSHKRKLLESVPGIGRITAINLLAHLPQLGLKNRKEIAAFVG